MDRTFLRFNLPRCCPPLLLAAVLMLCAGGCSQQQGRDIAKQFSNGKPDEFFQTSVDRITTLGMRDNLQSLYLLMSKLYLRNPSQWRQSGYPDAVTAAREIRQAIEQRRSLPALGDRRDLAALSYSLSPEFKGDRVGAFIYAIGSMLVTAHGGAPSSTSPIRSTRSSSATPRATSRRPLGC